MKLPFIPPWHSRSQSDDEEGRWHQGVVRQQRHHWRWRLQRLVLSFSFSFFYFVSFWNKNIFTNIEKQLFINMCSSLRLFWFPFKFDFSRNFPQNLSSFFWKRIWNFSIRLGIASIVSWWDDSDYPYNYFVDVWERGNINANAFNKNILILNFFANVKF